MDLLDITTVQDYAEIFLSEDLWPLQMTWHVVQSGGCPSVDIILGTLGCGATTYGSENFMAGRICEDWCMMQVVPGARVPADGCVVEGRSHVDESMVTGESAPVRKRAGDSIISGTVNTSGPLIVQARRPYM